MAGDAIISQKGVNKMVNALNQAGTDVNSAVKSYLPGFVSTVKSSWENGKAVDFAKSLNENLTAIFDELSKQIKGLDSALASNVKNHNKFNAGKNGGEEVSKGDVTFKKPNVSSLTEIKDKFGDGFIGLKGASFSYDDIVGNSGKMINAINKALEDAKTAIDGSEAFGSNDTKDVTSAYKNIINPRKENLNKTKTDIKTYIDDLVDDKNRLRTTNKGNLTTKS